MSSNVAIQATGTPKGTIEAELSTIVVHNLTYLNFLSLFSEAEYCDNLHRAR